MNINKTISCLRQRLKLFPVTVHHSCAQPTVRLPKECFNEIVPFLKCLLKSFERNGFDINISRWGEIEAFSGAHGIAVLLAIETPNPLSSLKNIKELWSEDNDFQTILVPAVDDRFVFRYFYKGTRSIWRDISIAHAEQNLLDFTEKVITEVLLNGRRFKGRLVSSPVAENEVLSLDDIKAFAKFASLNVTGVRAWRGVYKAFASDYIVGFSLTDANITLELEFSRASSTYYFHSSDLKFIRKFLPGFPNDYIQHGNSNIS